MHLTPREFDKLMILMVADVDAPNYSRINCYGPLVDCNV